MPLFRNPFYKLLNNNPINSSPTSADLFTGSAVLLPVSIFIFTHITSKWNEVKKLNTHHSILLLSSVCMGIGGILLLLLGFFQTPNIILSDSICVSYRHATLISCAGVLLLVVWAVFHVWVFLHWICVEIKNRLGRIDGSPIIAFLVTTKEVAVDFSRYIKEKFRSRLREIRESKKTKN